MSYFNHPGFQFCSIVNWTLEGTCSRLNKRLHRDKYKLTFLTLSFKPQFSVHLSPSQTIATCQRNISQHCWTNHVAPNNVAICCVDMLRSFGRGFKLINRWSKVAESHSTSSILEDAQRSGNANVTHKHLRLNSSKPGVFVCFLYHCRF